MTFTVLIWLRVLNKVCCCILLGSTCTGREIWGSCGSDGEYSCLLRHDAVLFSKYRRFGGSWCFRLHGMWRPLTLLGLNIPWGDSRILLNVSNCLLLYTGSRRHELLTVIVPGVQLKSGPLTKPWIFHVRCYLWYDIILLHVQELARLLQERGEPVLAIRISWISRQ